MIEPGDWRSRTASAITPTHSNIIIVSIITSDVIVTWPASARLVAAAASQVVPSPAGRVAIVMVTAGSDVTAAVTAAGKNAAVNGNGQR